MVAGDYVAREIDCLADDGRIAIIAVLGGAKSDFDAGLVLRRRLTITGSTLRPRPVAFKGAIARRCARRSGRCWRRRGEAGDPQHFAAARGGRTRMR